MNSVFEMLMCNLYFALDEGGDVILVLEDGERLQQILLQPFPVLRDLLTRAPCEKQRPRRRQTILIQAFRIMNFIWSLYLQRLHLLRTEQQMGPGSWFN